MCRPGQTFEHEVLGVLKLYGHKIERPPKLGPDGGVDMITSLDAPIGGGRYLVQCKDKEAVGREDVDKFIGTLERENVHMGIMVTSGRFVKKARKGTNGRVQFIDGPRYEELRKRLTEWLQIKWNQQR